MGIWYIDARPDSTAFRQKHGDDKAKEFVPPALLGELTTFLIENRVPDGETYLKQVFIRLDSGASEGFTAEPLLWRKQNDVADWLPTFVKDAEEKRLGLVLIDVSGQREHIRQALMEAEGLRPSLKAAIPSSVVAEVMGAGHSGGYGKFRKPTSTNEWLDDPARCSFGMATWINSLSALTDTSLPLGQVAVVICDPPEKSDWWPHGDPIRDLCLETADRINLELLQWLYRRTGTPLSRIDVNPGSQPLFDTGEYRSLAPIPGRLREVPPSLWGDYSPQQKLDLQRILNQVPDEFYTPSTERSFDLLSRRLGRKQLTLDPEGQGALQDRVKANLVYALRLCRRFAMRTLEGQPFECTVVFVSDVGIFQGGDTERINDWCRHCSGWSTDRGPSFAFTDQSLSEHMELIQGEGLVMFVDAQTLRVEAIGAQWDKEAWYRGMWCKRLAKDFGAVTVHLRGGCYVEVYDAEELELWYDGFSWRSHPFELPKKYLKEFFSFTRVQSTTTGESSAKVNPHATELTGRIVAAIVHLMDHHASSILVFYDSGSSGGSGCDMTGLDCLEPLRTGIRSRLARTTEVAQSIKEISLPALFGIFRLDGVHVINAAGDLIEIARKLIR